MAAALAFVLLRPWRGPSGMGRWSDRAGSYRDMRLLRLGLRQWMEPGN